MYTDPERSETTVYTDPETLPDDLVSLCAELRRQGLRMPDMVDQSVRHLAIALFAQAPRGTADEGTDIDAVKFLLGEVGFTIPDKAATLKDLLLVVECQQRRGRKPKPKPVVVERESDDDDPWDDEDEDEDDDEFDPPFVRDFQP